MTQTTWEVGDKVRPAPGEWPRNVNPAVVLTIVTTPNGKGRVNYIAEDETGVQYRSRAEGFIDAASPIVGPTGATVTAAEAPPLIHPGMIVMIRTRTHPEGEGPYVILNVTSGGYKCSATKIGGDSGRYLRGVGTKNLAVIDPARIAIAAA